MRHVPAVREILRELPDNILSERKSNVGRAQSQLEPGHLERRWRRLRIQFQCFRERLQLSRVSRAIHLAHLAFARGPAISQAPSVVPGASTAELGSGPVIVT